MAHPDIENSVLWDVLNYFHGPVKECPRLRECPRIFAKFADWRSVDCRLSAGRQTDMACNSSANFESGQTLSPDSV